MGGSSQQRVGLLTTLAYASLAFLLSYLAGYNLDRSPPVLQQALRRLVSLPVGNGTMANHALYEQPSQCGLAGYFADEKVPGLHFACITQSHAKGKLKVVVYRDGQNLSSVKLYSEPSFSSLHFNLEDVLELSLESRLGRVPRGDSTPNTAQPWAMFTPNGRRVTDLQGLEKGGGSMAVFIYEGGSFIWPGVRVGHEQVVDEVQHLGQIKMKTLSMRPLVFSVDGFLLPEECRYIREASEPHMQQSGVALMDHDRGKEATDWRTSTTYFMPTRGHRYLQGIDQRVADLTRQPISHQEHVQVLRYEQTQRYDVHHDYFDTRVYSDPSTLQLIDHGKRNRMSTVLWYLSDVEGGGETIFPKFEGRPDPYDKRDCLRMEGALRSYPREGKVILFYSLRPDGFLDEDSLHGSCSVASGTKWAANKWIWNRPIAKLVNP